MAPSLSSVASNPVVPRTPKHVLDKQRAKGGLLTRCVPSRSFLVKAALACLVLFVASRLAPAHCGPGFLIDPQTNQCVRDMCKDVECPPHMTCVSRGNRCDHDCNFPYVKEGTLCVSICDKHCQANARCWYEKGTGCAFQCNEGFSKIGNTCQEWDPCLTSLCPKNAECAPVKAEKGTVDAEGKPVKKVCKAQCDNGFVAHVDSVKKTTECRPEHPCESFECPEGATCSEIDNVCVSKCLPGFELSTGQNRCVRKDACSESAYCPENAVCSVGSDGKSCVAQCVGGYTLVNNACVPEKAFFDPCEAYTCPEGKVCEKVGRSCVIKQ